MIRRAGAAALVMLSVIACAPTTRPAESGPTAASTASVQRGLVLPTWERHGYRDSATHDALSGITSVGANWIQLVPTWYQAAFTSSTIKPSASTVDDGDVRFVVRLAHRLGVKVMLKPHVDVSGGGDRARIRPANRAAWFTSYREFIMHYASLAAELEVDQFAVGTELAGTSDDRTRWLATIAAVRAVYGGQLIYAANHSEYEDVTFWDAVDLIGIDVYWPLTAQPTTDVSVLRRAFETKRPHLVALSAEYGRPILFTEAGFASQRGASTAPWSASISRQPAEAEQAAAYDAMLSTFTGQPWWAGVFFWTWRVSHRYEIEPPPALDHSVDGKAAADVLRAWWAPALGAKAAS